MSGTDKSITELMNEIDTLVHQHSLLVSSPACSNMSTKNKFDFYNSSIVVTFDSPAEAKEVVDDIVDLKKLAVVAETSADYNRLQKERERIFVKLFGF